MIFGKYHNEKWNLVVKFNKKCHHHIKEASCKITVHLSLVLNNAQCSTPIMHTDAHLKMGVIPNRVAHTTHAHPRSNLTLCNWVKARK